MNELIEPHVSYLLLIEHTTELKRTTKLNGYDLKNSIKKLEEYEKAGTYWVETEPSQFDPLVYYKGRVMMEYLIDIKHLSFSQIFDKDVIEDDVIDEMKKWYHQQQSKRIG